ncbi:MAG: anion transporter [Methanoregulaceae archaeon]
MPDREIDPTEIAVVVLLAVIVLIAVRQVGRFRLRIWQIMLGGAVIVVLTGAILPAEAFSSIDWNVMIFLCGMFIVGEGLDRSGYLDLISQRLIRKAGRVDHLILILLFSFGILSAFLMNDTLAVIGTGLVLGYSRRFGISGKLLLLTLAVAITTGSVMSPIGNPQNLLVAQYSGMDNPFLLFFIHLGIPTLINLAICFPVLRWIYRDEFGSRILVHSDDPGPVPSKKMTLPARLSLAILVLLIAAAVLFSWVTHSLGFPLPLIGICAALPFLIMSSERKEIVKNIDWATLVFFAAMFILMASVWRSGFFQEMIGSQAFASLPAILSLSVIVSQFISNVPFVALFQPMIARAGGGLPGILALAAGSTIAGNLTILGAASNVIIIQNAERQGMTITFREFLRAGIPLTVIQIFVYWLFLSF